MAYVLEPYCDSDEEVFFGPVTEKEKLIRQALDTKRKLNDHLKEVSARYMGEDEGLHTLAEAASMLSISSVKEERVSQEATVEISFNRKSPSLPVREDGRMANGSESGTVELEAVKCLSQHIPEQNVKYEIVSPQAESADEAYHSPGVPHHTSLASSVDNGSSSFNNPIYADSAVDSFLVLEAQCKAEDSLEKKCGNLIPICELEQLPPLNLSTTELQDVNNRSDFEMKLSDNEEEREKEERKKVEEIIKFLSDEDIKTESEETKETCLEISECLPNIPPQNGKAKLNEDDDDVIIIKINDLEIVDLTDSPSLKKEKDTSTEVNVKYELNYTNSASLDQDIQKEVCVTEPFQTNVPLSNNHIVMEKKPNDDVDVCVKHEEMQSEFKDKLVKLSSSKSEERDEKQICNEDVKVPRLLLEEEGKKEVRNLPVMKQQGKAPSSIPNDALVTQRRLKTPSKVVLRPAHGAGTTNLHKQTLFGDIKKYPVTTAPLKSPLPSRNAMPSARTPLRGISGTPGRNFKTPNSKTNAMGSSKIPQVLHPVTPSPRKNKYADIMSPVAQYIHGKSTLLLANKYPQGVKSTVNREPVNNKSDHSEQTKSVSTENIDVNNIPIPPMPSNINYKSAVPVKIFSPSPKKCQDFGPIGSVSKHIGRIKITSLKTGDVQTPLSMQCRDSLIPDGEVSVLLTKEMSAEYSSML